MRIAIVNTKGGVGKTTTTIYLATAAVKKCSVELWDADPQGSATEWSLFAKEEGTALPFEVKTVNRVTVGRAKDSCEITIIDTPPGGSDLLQEAIDSADVIIVPTSPSPLDVQRVWKTLEATAAKPTGVLLTNTEPHTTLLSDTRSIFDEENIFVFDTMIPKRQAIKRSMGTLPDDLYGYDILFDEVMEAI